MADALNMHALEIDLATERNAGQDGELVGRVDAVDIKAGIGLGIAHFLRVCENAIEIPPGFPHRGQDIIAGAVQNAVDPIDPVARKALAQRLDDRDAARHGGLEP